MMDETILSSEAGCSSCTTPTSCWIDIEERSSCSSASSISDDGDEQYYQEAYIRTPARSSEKKNTTNVEPRRVHFARDESLQTRRSSPGEIIGKKTWAHKNDSSSKNISNGTFLPHLDLGDIANSQDMIAECSRSWYDYNQESVALEKIQSLQKHDFAFVLRSDGNFRYAIIAGRQDGVIVFVVDTEGSTKILSKKHWLSFIRLVNNQQAPMPLSKDSWVCNGHPYGNGQLP